MGRAERRIKERRNRIESRKNKILMDKKELSDMKHKITNEASSYNAGALLTCFGLAQCRLFGFKKKRILRTLQYIDDLMELIVNDEKTIEDYKTELKEEAGVVIKC